MARKELLTDKVARVAAAVDRSAIAALVGRMVAKKQHRAEALAEARAVAAVDAADTFMDTPIPGFTDVPRPARRRRASRRELNTKMVRALVSSPWSSDLRFGTKRWKKLEYVLGRIKDNDERELKTYVASLLGSVYDADSGETLDGHDINGMAERGHIALEG